MIEITEVGLIRYSCSHCGAEEVIWNSMAGEVPNYATCLNCGKLAVHIKEQDVLTPPSFKSETNRWIEYTSIEEYEIHLRRVNLSFFKTKKNKEEMIKTLLDEYIIERNPVLVDKRVKI